MRINCPTCGNRTNDEFAYLGDADVLMARPVGSDATAMATYVYERANPAGRLRELWYHQSGCRQWLVVTRDTRTHEIFGVQVAKDVALARGNSAAAKSGVTS